MKTKIYMKQRTKKTKEIKKKKVFLAHQTISKTEIQILVTPNQFENEQRKEQKTTSAMLSTIRS